MVTKKPDNYLTLWYFQQGERQIITVDRMVFLDEEKDFVAQKKMRQKTGSDKETMVRELESKKNNEKFYLNSQINYPWGWRRQAGFSIYRYQLPELISALQSICDGEQDDKMSFKISKWINQSTEEPQFEMEADSEEETEESHDNADDHADNDSGAMPKVNYDKWVSEQPERIKKEILQLQRDGWTKERIYNMINSKDYRDVYDE